MAPRGRCGGRTRMSAHGAAMTPRTSPPKMAPAIRQNRCSVSALTGPPRSLPSLPALSASFRPYRVRLRYRCGSKAAERPVPGCAGEGSQDGGALLWEGGVQDGSARCPDLPPPPPPLPPPRRAHKMEAPARDGSGALGAPRTLRSGPTAPSSSPPSGTAPMRRPKMAQVGARSSAAAQDGGGRGTRMRRSPRRSAAAPHLQPPAARRPRAPLSAAAAARSGPPPPR
ncbi:uncharacterized protein LOC128802017 [Vidua chalybeata]|uniref:uncharacterized protein LOC128802017 n=1 Tax=Vidua chalybeata TaxID=81927 RepID=UPI0023A83C11|nr:uncharacterized protein LOC128802017 [Vidua chalybeata]